jgi:hypothetical protein
MATFLDIGLLQKFDIIFPFLLVFVFIWGLLGYSKFMGENKAVHGFIALILGLLVLLSAPIREIINRMAPWFVLLFIFIMFLLMLSGMSGEGASMGGGEYKWMNTTFIIITFIIVIFTIIDVMVWDEDTETAADTVTGGSPGDTGKEGFFAVLRHPAVLGMLLILIIASFTIQRLTVEK